LVQNAQQRDERRLKKKKKVSSYFLFGAAASVRRFHQHCFYAPPWPLLEARGFFVFAAFFSNSRLPLTRDGENRKKAGCKKKPQVVGLVSFSAVNQTYLGIRGVFHSGYLRC
jgi:hypothetical protein